MTDVLVIGAGPAGVIAALCAADLGARVALVTSDEFGGMATNDGPVPVRTLSQGARLIREARELGQFGGAVSESVLGLSPTACTGTRSGRRCEFACLPCASGSMPWE